MENFIFYFLVVTDTNDYVNSGEITHFGESREDARTKLIDFMEDFKEEDYHEVTIFDTEEELNQKL